MQIVLPLDKLGRLTILKGDGQQHVDQSRDTWLVKHGRKKRKKDYLIA